MSNLRDMIVSIAFKDNASKAVQEVNKSMDAAKKAFSSSSTSAMKTSDAVKNIGKTMKTTASEVKRTDSGFKATASTMKNVQNAFKTSGQEAGKLSGTFQKVRTSAKTVGSTADSTSRRVGQMGRAFDSVKKTLDSTGGAFGKFSKSAVSGFSRAVSSVNRGANNARSALSNLGRSATVGFGNITAGAASMAGAIGIVKAFSGAVNMVRSSMDSAFGRIDTMEQFGRVMTTMLGNESAANDALKVTNDIVKGTAYGLDTAAGSVQRFTTSGTDIKKTTGYVAAFSDAVAFFGDGSDETFSRVNSAMAEMATSGTASLGLVRTLTEANIPVFQMYAEATGKSAKEVQKSLENGKIPASEFLDTLTGAMMDGTKSFKSIKGAAKEAGASWKGTFANMGSAVARGSESIIKSIDKILTDNGLPDMRGLIANFGSAFENTLNKVADAVPAVIEVFKQVKPVFDGFMSGFSNIAEPLKEVFSGLGSSVTSFVTDVIIPYLPQVKENFTNAFDAIAPVVESVGSILSDIGSVVTNLYENVILPVIPILQSTVTSAFEAIQPVISAVATAFSFVKNTVLFLVENVVVPLIPILSSVIQTAFDIVNPILRIAKSLFDAVWTVIEFLVTGIILPLVPGIADVFTGMWGILKPILDGMVSIFNGIADAIQWAVDKFKSFADAAKNFKMPKIGLPKFMGGGGLIQMGSHATGLGRVPYDEYPMFAHKDEAVLTAEQSNALRAAGMLKGDGVGPTLDMSRGSSSSGPTSTTSTSHNNNTFHFHISGQNAEDIGRRVRDEIEALFARMNAVTE